MKHRNIAHSKIKNPGILFEMLVRRITLDAMEGSEKSIALGLLKKYFNPNTQMGQELQLYHAFMANGQLSETKAVHFIDLILSRRKKLDEKILAREKYQLIKDIKDHYDLKDFLSARINNYKIFASVYKTFLAEVSNSDITNIQDIISSKFALIEHLTVPPNKKLQENSIFSTFKKQPEDLRLLTYKVLIEKFNDKYSNLDINQKALLREYINNVSNTSTLQTFILSKIPTLKNELLVASKNSKDKVMQIKLHEVASQLNNIAKNKIIKDNEVSALMIAYEIIKELQ